MKTEVSDINLNNLNYETDLNSLNKVFLLHNILASNSANTVQKNRFPFNLYKKVKNDGGWSIEHIHAQQSKIMKEDKAIREWLQETYQAIKDINNIEQTIKNEEGIDESKNVQVTDELKNEMIKMMQSESINVEEFNLLKSELIELFDSVSLHVLDNLALLSKKDNSALNNSIFPVKRNKIIQLEKDGKFIPITTKNVFLKYYSESNLQPFYWSKEDKISYSKNIQSQLKPYLNHLS